MCIRDRWSLAYVENNKALIVAGGGIAPLVELFRDGPGNAKPTAAWALRNLAYANDANAVAIAAAVGLEALVELARRGRVTVDDRSVVSTGNAGAKCKAALVVAALFKDGVPGEVPDDIKAAIGSYL